MKTSFTLPNLILLLVIILVLLLVALFLYINRVTKTRYKFVNRQHKVDKSVTYRSYTF